MMAALGSMVQWGLVATAVISTLFLVGPYVIYPLRERLCPHRGDVVVLKRSRYEAMLNAIDAQRVENAELQEVIARRLSIEEPVIGASTADEDRQTAERLDAWLRKQGAR